MLYYADITELGPLPEAFEMVQRMLTEKLPDNLTYPDIYPVLFLKVQGWMNLQNSSDEIWDVYDENRNLTGQLHRRGEALGRGEYHLVVHVWIQNKDGSFLLTKRSHNKGFPNMWESTGGSALTGEDSLTAAIREVKEETGLSLDETRGTLISSARMPDCFRDIWLFRQDFVLDKVILQPGETTDKMEADKNVILSLQQSGDLVPYDYLSELFAAAEV